MERSSDWAAPLALAVEGGECETDDGATANPFTLRYLLVGGFSYESNACCLHRLGIFVNFV